MFTKFIGLVIVFASLIAVYLFDLATPSVSSSILRVLHWPAVLLTGLGPFGVVLICSEWTRLQDVCRILWKGSPAESQRQLAAEGELLQDLAAHYYLRGPSVFDSKVIEGLSRPCSRTLERLSMRIGTADAISLLERDRDNADRSYSQALEVVGIGVRIAPSVGMLGTILGMVQLLSNLKDTTNIGSYMGMALLTTFYGLFFSIIFWTPLCQRLEAQRGAELAGFDQTLHWLEILATRKPTHYFNEIISAK